MSIKKVVVQLDFSNSDMPTITSGSNFGYVLPSGSDWYEDYNEFGEALIEETSTSKPPKESVDKLVALGMDAKDIISLHAAGVI